MTAKKAQAKRGGKQTVKRSSSRRKAVRHLATKKSSGESSTFLKAPRGTVVVGSKSKPSALAVLGLKIFSEAVQDALREFAELGIPAVVMENGKLIKAVPTIVGGRYVVVDSQGAESDRLPRNARKRRVRAG
jgi:hypothetical protein